jgi:hypothetical protein
MNYLELDRHLVRQRNDELLREVRELRLGARLRAKDGARSGRPRVPGLAWRRALSMLRGADLPK